MGISFFNARVLHVDTENVFFLKGHKSKRLKTTDLI